LHNNKTGNNNVALGLESLFNNIEGDNNVASGFQSLFKNIDGDNNVASGYQSLYNNTIGNTNVALGRESLFNNIEGDDNIALGIQSLYRNTTGNYNIASGYISLLQNTTGSYNIAYGYNAGNNTTVGSNQTGSNSIFIGKDTRANADGEENQIVIGASATGKGSNTVTLGGPAITATYLKGDVQGSGAATFASSVTATEFIGDGAKLTGIYRQPSYTVNTEYAELGGYVIQISPNGKHGLVVAMQDQGNSNWYGASNLLSNPSKHDAAGKEFLDWRLPTKRELALMYVVYNNGNAARLNTSTYWSSTELDNSSAWVHNFLYNVQASDNKSGTFNVRAVRAF
jgi:hypothetical protein